jgi:signal transduction histidine kinase
MLDNPGHSDATSPFVRRREWLIPFAAALAMVAVAIATLALTNSARDKGLSALEEAKGAEIRASADSREQQLVSFLTSTSALAAQPWEFAPNSAADTKILDSYRSPTARTGFFLLDPSNRVTDGVLLEGNVIGTTYDHPGFAEARASQEFNRGRGAILPVGDGLTTGVPVFALALPVVNRTTGAYRGCFVAEVDVSTESSFNQEISQLVRHRTDQVLIADSRGVVLAASRSDQLDTDLDPKYRDLSTGFHRVGDEVVVVAPVPSAGWQVVFRQDASEFDHAVAQPLQDAGRILVVVLLVVGVGLFYLLLRRLRAAREEQVRLARLNATQEEFISIVSHELRTPVAGIIGFLQTALDHWDRLGDEERQTTVRRAAISARRLQALTRDVLDAESVEAGRMAFAFEPTDITDEIRAAVEAAEALHVDRPLEVSLPPTPVMVNADADRLQQVMTNLLDNATKNSPPGSSIGVQLVVQDGHARVGVTDAGPGFDPALGQNVFDKFVRGRGSTVTGTGLGLYVCRLVVEAHGGTIAAGRNGDGRTELAFEIPLAAADD